MPLKKRIFDPLLLQRLAEFDMGLNTPWVPEGTVADIYDTWSWTPNSFLGGIIVPRLRYPGLGTYAGADYE